MLNAIDRHRFNTMDKIDGDDCNWTSFGSFIFELVMRVPMSIRGTCGRLDYVLLTHVAIQRVRVNGLTNSRGEPQFTRYSTNEHSRWVVPLVFTELYFSFSHTLLVLNNIKTHECCLVKYPRSMAAVHTCSFFGWTIKKTSMQNQIYQAKQANPTGVYVQAVGCWSGISSISMPMMSVCGAEPRKTVI